MIEYKSRFRLTVQEQSHFGLAVGIMFNKDHKDAYLYIIFCKFFIGFGWL